MRTLIQPALFRYMRHLPPRMLVGKAKHFMMVRLFAYRAAMVEPPADANWLTMFGKRELKSFANVFKVQGERFALTCDSLHRGEFISNGVSYSFGSPDGITWSGPALASAEFMRWHHDLAHFFFAMPLMSGNPRRGITTIASMVKAMDNRLKQDPSEIQEFHWSPIATASRSLALVGAMALARAEEIEDNEAVAAIGVHLWRCVEVLRLTVERYLGFNHAATTEAGLAVGLLFQGRTDQFERSISKLIEVLEEGTLEDGMWAERTSSYHIHMLIIVEAVQATLQPGSCAFHRLDDLSRRMRLAMTTLIHPDGEIAVFNDAAVADAPSPSSIGIYPSEDVDLQSLPFAGYARLSSGDTVAIVDAGPMGPDAVIGHGHADFLSIEVSVGSYRLIVDPGVASLSPGVDRLWTRSAITHNGPTVKGREPAEFFGTWRVGRRGTAWFQDLRTDRDGTVSTTAACSGYKRWGVMVERRVEVDSRGTLTILDRWISDGDCDGAVSFLVPIEWRVERVADATFELTHCTGVRVSLTIGGGNVFSVSDSRYFREGPMKEERATLLSISADATLVSTKVSRVN